MNLKHAALSLAFCAGIMAPPVHADVDHALAAAVPATPAPLHPDEARYLDDSAATRAVAEPYYAAYIDRRWDALQALMHADATWRDATAMQLFGGTEHHGRERVMAYFRQAYAGIRDMRAQITRQFFSSHTAVFEANLDWTIDIGKGRQARTPAMPFVVVLTLRDGKVVDHQDLADYATFIDAMRAARAVK